MKWKMLLRGAAAALLLGTCLGATLDLTTLQESGFTVELPNRYSLVCAESEAPEPLRSPQLVHLGIVATYVTQIFVDGNMIGGVAGDGYFLVDSSKPDADPVFYADLTAWQEAARARSCDVRKAMTPAEMAHSLPDIVVRPFRYRVMKGKFGFSDSTWAVIHMAAGAVLMFFLGLVKLPLSDDFLGFLGAIAGFVAGIYIYAAVNGGGLATIPFAAYLAVSYCLTVTLGRETKRRTQRGQHLPMQPGQAPG